MNDINNFDLKAIERIVTVARGGKSLSVQIPFALSSFLNRFPQFTRVDFTDTKNRVFVLSKCSTGAEFQPFKFIPDTEVQQLAWRLKIQVLFFADPWGGVIHGIFDLNLNARGYLELIDVHRFTLAKLAKISLENKKIHELEGK